MLVIPDIHNNYVFLTQFFLEWPFEVLCFSLKFIEETYDTKFHQMTFCDCLGVGLQAAVIASTFKFAETISIEVSEEEALKTQRILQDSPFEVESITVRMGRMQVIMKIWFMKRAIYTTTFVVINRRITLWWMPILCISTAIFWETSWTKLYFWNHSSSVVNLYIPEHSSY